jgi:acetoin utilization deacetylase AcuC-like enzyme
VKTKIIFSEKCLTYGSCHIEGPERVRKAYSFLKDKGYEFLETTSTTEENVFNVHDPEYLWRLKKGLVEDGDTPAYANIYEYAKISAGGAILAAKVGGFSLIRPPGHHAGIRGAALGAFSRGFCYLNNIAIAVKYLDEPTLIIDIDGHHGNGTQEIFLDDKKVTYISLHRYPYYPGTGYDSKANCLNFPLEANCGDKKYLKTFDAALSKVNIKKICRIGVSAGFDAHLGDLASLGLTENCYLELGKRIATLNKPTFFVLEGGYSGIQLGKDIDFFLKGFEE